MRDPKAKTIVNTELASKIIARRTEERNVQQSVVPLGVAGSQCGSLPEISIPSSTRELELNAQIAMMKIIGRELLHSALRDGPSDDLIRRSVDLFGGPLDKEDLSEILAANQRKKNGDLK